MPEQPGQKTLLSKDPLRKTPAGAAKLKTPLILGASALVAIGVAYGVGRAQGTSKLKESETRLEATTTEHGRELGELQKEIAAARQTRARLEARRRLHRALIVLDERNFGIAHGHLEAAALLLGQSANEGEGEVRALADELGRFKLVATEDFASQRQRILGWALRIDELVPLQDPQR